MSNAVSVTLYDLQGKAIDPKIIKSLEQAAENLARQEACLAINIAKE